MTTTTLSRPGVRSEQVQRPRALEGLVRGQVTTDGDGVRLTRVIGHGLQQRLDPYLMLDAFGTDEPRDYIGGFPDHPHRGFEAITYMIAGRMRHRDSAGHEGLLQNGDVQWMVAGSGLVHSEMPEQEDGRMEGFQLWLNLPAADKMTAPAWRDIPAAAIPRFVTDAGAEVSVIAGSSHGVQGAMQRPVTEPLYLDMTIEPGGRFAQPLPAERNVFIYVYRGELHAGGRTVSAGYLGLFANSAGSDGLELSVAADAEGSVRAILVAGQPLREPIAQHGPFVMNTREQLYQAAADYQSGAFHAVRAGTL
ncbi:pirin family protein [Plasticicumulans acidivorans]|uniref:Pirin n=1 Tax=Plasticicumulans acidivorans TaxID=886464 RepID=A0A317MWB8_9GAMM|nr:pirin family protein [Plasticicumulans acidivorans]PWV63121.1 hypothetical protein C7443_10345 [Plasticicumulans acidivorans]